MRTWPVTDERGNVSSFEVSMLQVGLGEIEGILRSTGEVSVLIRRPLFSEPSDVHIRFSYRGADYVVWEPFGDNSRYWICPSAKPTQPRDVAELESIFRAYKPSILKRLTTWKVK